MENQIESLRLKVLSLGLMAAFFGYVAWSSIQIRQLENKLARVESSHYALGRYTYDLGTAMVQTNTYGGFTGKQLADLLLASMREDDVLRPLAPSSQAAVVFIQEKQSARNATWALSR
jgi:hypothetical protein